MNPNNSDTRQKQPLTRKSVEKILREVGLVLWLTRQVRREILHGTATELVDKTPTRRAEDQPPFAAV